MIFSIKEERYQDFIKILGHVSVLKCNFSKNRKNRVCFCRVSVVFLCLSANSRKIAKLFEESRETTETPQAGAPNFSVLREIVQKRRGTFFFYLRGVSTPS